MNKKVILSVLIFLVLIFGLYYLYNQNYFSMIGHGHPQIHSEEQFIFEMVPHHREAIETSKYINLITENDELKELTQNIVEAQELEIDMMRGWINKWYPEVNYPFTYKNMMPELRNLNNEDAEKAYLNGMIEHHLDAVMMAEQVLAIQSKPEVKEFAQRIINVQNSEIELMKNLLKNY